MRASTCKRASERGCARKTRAWGGGRLHKLLTSPVEVLSTPTGLTSDRRPCAGAGRRGPRADRRKDGPLASGPSLRPMQMQQAVPDEFLREDENGELRVTRRNPARQNAAGDLGIAETARRPRAAASAARVHAACSFRIPTKKSSSMRTHAHTQTPAGGMCSAARRRSTREPNPLHLLHAHLILPSAWSDERCLLWAGECNVDNV